jgi:hypothetical protein
MPRRTALAAAVLFLALPAQADPRQPPGADYTADMAIVADGAPTQTVKTALSKGRMRMEVSQDGQTFVTLIDRPKKTVTNLIVSQKTYQTMPLEGPDPLLPLAGAEVTVEKQGEETVGGIPATKYRIAGKGRDGRPLNATIWTTKENIQVKMTSEDEVEGKKVAFVMELKNLKIGPVDEALFTIPADYKPMPAPPPEKK